MKTNSKDSSEETKVTRLGLVFLQFSHKHSEFSSYDSIARSSFNFRSPSSPSSLCFCALTSHITSHEPNFNNLIYLIFNVWNEIKIPESYVLLKRGVFFFQVTWLHTTDSVLCSFCVCACVHVHFVCRHMYVQRPDVNLRHLPQELDILFIL